MKRPLLMIAVLYAAGVLLGDIFPLPLTPSLVSSVMLVLLCFVAGRLRPIVLGVVVVLIGAANLSRQTAIISPHDLRVVVGDRIEQVTLRGTLPRTPSPRTYERRGETSWRTLAELDVTALRFDNADVVWQPAFGRVTITTPGTLPREFFEGQEVEISGRVHSPQPAIADGLFDYRNYLRRLGIYYQVQAESIHGWKLIGNPGKRVPLKDRFVEWGKAALARGLPAEDESLRLEWALTLGWKPALTEEVSEPFIRAATYHIFAVDGLRIAIISGIFLRLFQVFSLSRPIAGLLGIPVIWGYVALTGWPASAIRAAVMATVVIVGWAAKRPSDLINSLFAAALIILLWQPSQLFQAGFQLSFLVVLCIILLMPAFDGLIKHWLRPDPWLPPEPRKPSPPWLFMAGRFLADTFLVSMAAWLGSIPLSALYFHILTPVSGPANLLAVPLCALVLVCNGISLLLAGWFPWAAEMYNHAGWFFMESIRVSSHWFTHWPAAYFNVAAPALSTTVLFYVALLAVGTGWAFKIRHRAWVLGGLALLIGLWCAQWLIERQTTRMTVLPLKGAAAIFVDAPGQANDLLIDCGNENSAGFTLKPFLQGQGVNRLAHLLLTHGDVNHVGGAEVVRANFMPSQINVSPVPFRSTPYRQLMRRLESAPGLVSTVQRSNNVGSWQVLHPDAHDRFPLADDNAIVLRNEMHGARVLLMSDLGKPGQNALFNREPGLRADIVVAGLPQQSEPLAEAVIDAIQPRLIIIADSEYPASARASRKLRERLRHRGIPVLYTVDTGAITLLFGRKGWEVRTSNPI